MPAKSKRSGPSSNFELKETDGVKTIVASRNLKAGCLILTEKPILCAKSVDEVVENFEKLSTEDQEKVLEMTAMIKVPKKSEGEEGEQEEDNKSKLTKLFYSNTMSAAGQALYYVLSRVKHSCGPNIALVTMPGTFGHIEVRACREIKKGAELRADYLPGIYLFETKEMRSKVLGMNYKCDCKVCGLEGKDGQENETTRFRIRENYRNTTIYVTCGDFLQALEHCKAMLGFMDYLEEEVMVKKVSVTLECWQLAVLAQLQRPEVTVEVEKYKEAARELCALLGPIQQEKWTRTETMVAEDRLEEMDTVKLRASGPWTEQIIRTLLKKDVVKPAEPVGGEEPAKEETAKEEAKEVTTAKEEEAPVPKEPVTVKPERKSAEPEKIKPKKEEKTDSEKATSSTSENSRRSSKTKTKKEKEKKEGKDEKKEGKEESKKIEDNKSKSTKTKTTKKNDKADDKLNIKSTKKIKPKV